MYIRGGYNVFPSEVEAVLTEHPEVLDVAVAPRPHEVMGEIGVALVVPRDPDRPPTLEQLRAHAAERLAHHKLPEDVVVVAWSRSPARGSRPPGRPRSRRMSPTPGPRVSFVEVPDVQDSVAAADGVG